MENSIKIATPISHLFDNGKLSSKILNLSDCLECRDHSIDKDFKSQELFHCDLQPIHKFSEDDINSLIKMCNLKNENFLTANQFFLKIHLKYYF